MRLANGFSCTGGHRGVEKVMSVSKTKAIPKADQVFDRAELVSRAAEAAFDRAAKAAVAENDRLGITTHGAVGGRLVERPPHRGPAPVSAKS